MKSENSGDKIKEPYAPPRILATYDRQALEERVQPHGQTPYEEGSGGCGCGSILCN
jgi:hypothetical protein